jgi:hypothetical protein
VAARRSVSDIDQQSASGPVGVQYHLHTALGELECILQQVAECRGQHFRIRIHNPIVIDRDDSQANSAL